MFEILFLPYLDEDLAGCEEGEGAIKAAVQLLIQLTTLGGILQLAKRLRAKHATSAMLCKYFECAVVNSVDLLLLIDRARSKS